MDLMSGASWMIRLAVVSIIEGKHVDVCLKSGPARLQIELQVFGGIV